jgi:hypothetical protein
MKVFVEQGLGVAVGFGFRQANSEAGGSVEGTLSGEGTLISYITYQRPLPRFR